MEDTIQGTRVHRARGNKNTNYMGTVIGGIIRYVSHQLWENRSSVLLVYSVGSVYPMRVVAELPRGGLPNEEVTIATVMPGILGDTSVTVELNNPIIERLGIDQASLEKIVIDAEGVRNVA